jgi:O-antigen ligase
VRTLDPSVASLPRDDRLLNVPRVVALSEERRPPQLRLATVFYVTIAMLLVGNLGRIPVFSTGGRDVPILVNDLAVAALIVAGAVAMAGHRSLRLDWVSGFALLFAGFGAMSAALAVPRFNLTTFEALVSVGYLARWLFYFSLYLVAINTLRPSDAGRVWRALEWAILIFAAFGIFQSAFLPDFAQLVYPESRPQFDWDVQGHRLVSTFLDPNFAGAFIDIGLVVSLSRLVTGARVSGWKLLLLAVALVLTVSRSAILALLVGGVAILVIAGLSKRLLRAIGVAAVLVMLALPRLLALASSYHKLTVDPSALARLTSWLHGWMVLRDHWVIGIGFNTWGYVAERYGWLRSFSATFGIDGGLFFILVLTGVFGLALYLGMLWSVIRAARRVWRDPAMSPDARGLAIGAAASIPMIVVHSLFTNSLLLPFLMEALWILWAMPFVMASES